MTDRHHSSDRPALTFGTESYNIQKDDIILVYSAAGGLGINLTQVGRGSSVN